MSMVDVVRYNEFCEGAQLNKTYWPYCKKREQGKEYAMFMIHTCRHKDWWYRDFIGIEFLGVIVKQQYREDEVHPVRLMSTKFVFGRGIPIGDLMIV